MTLVKNRQCEFLEKVNQSQNILYHICSVYTHNREDWQDLWQEILLQLWRSFSSFKEKSAFSTWMYRVALNTALMYQRRKKRSWFHSSPEMEILLDDQMTTSPQDEDIKILYQCIQKLSPLDRAIILLKLEQKSYLEIAEITGFSESNVSVRIVRIKTKLRQLLGERGIKGA